MDSADGRRLCRYMGGSPELHGQPSCSSPWDSSCFTTQHSMSWRTAQQDLLCAGQVQMQKRLQKLVLLGHEFKDLGRDLASREVVTQVQ